MSKIRFSVLLFGIGLAVRFGFIFKRSEIRRALSSPLPICDDTSPVLPRPVSPCELGIFGMDAVGPAMREDCFPAWINTTKFFHGQTFFTNNWGSLEVGAISMLLGLLSIPSIGNILLFTATHDCPAKAKRRFVTTVNNVHTWCTTPDMEILLESVSKVRQAHVHVGRRLRSADKVSPGRDLKKEVLKMTRNASLQDQVWEAFKMDLEAAFTADQLQFSHCYLEGMTNYKYLNQFEYAMTQWSFATMSALDKVRALVPRATDEDLEAFNHMWGVIGWILGIDDRFNAALQPNLTAQAQYYQELTELYVIPSLYNIDTVSKYLMELTLERTSPFPQSIFNGWNFIPLDGLLLSTLHFGLNIPYTNLYAVASGHGRMWIHAMELLVAGSSFPSVIQPIILSGMQPIHEVWGAESWGECYRKWDTDEKKAKYLHYYYNGPDLNPNGIYSNCSQFADC